VSTTAGSAMTDRMRMGPPQRSQTRTSTANTRRRSAAHGIPWVSVCWGVAGAASVSAGVGGSGTMRARA
jgi:hypothetical protein